MRSGLKKRGAILVLLLVFALVAAACSSDDSSDDTTTTAAGGDDATTTTAAGGDDTTTTAAAETTTTAAPAPAVPVGMAYDIGGRGDQSFNDSAAAGLDKAVVDYGIESTELEPSAGGENREENLRLLAEAGNELVFGIGFAFAEAVGNAAADFPDTAFAIVDDASLADVPNVTSLIFAEEQGSALVGAAAALKTTTGKIGFIGGVAGLGLIEKFQAGFEFGAKFVDPDIEIVSQYLTEFPDFAGFSDPAKGKEAALAQYQAGADIVYHAAGGSGAGVFEAAKETSEASGTKVWAIGVDSDQFLTADAAVQEYILTSMLKRVDVAVYSTITSFLSDGNQSGVVLLDLASDGVGYSTSGGFVDDIAADLDALRVAIVTGEVEVPTEPEG
jgi:basic membrane protein A